MWPKLWTDVVMKSALKLRRHMSQQPILHHILVVRLLKQASSQSVFSLHLAEQCASMIHLQIHLKKPYVSYLNVLCTRLHRDYYLLGLLQL